MAIALDVGGHVVVLGSGVDQAYARSHGGLLAEVLKRGTIVSEQPSGAHPTRQTFLQRNRILASLEAGSVMVEAAHRSGTRSVLSWAARLGRPAMAAPGPVTSHQRVAPRPHPQRSGRPRHRRGRHALHPHTRQGGGVMTQAIPIHVTDMASLLAVVPCLSGFHPADSLVALAIARGRVVLTARMDAADGLRPDAAQQFVSPLVAAASRRRSW